MAKYVVPPRAMSREIIIRCANCRALYVPEHKKKYLTIDTDYENCPVCGYTHNSDSERIPLWKYNLIKYFRERAKNHEQPDDCSTDD